MFLREDIYSGRELDKAPDVILMPNAEWAIRSSLRWREVFSYGKGNEHDLNGIFIANGPDVGNGKILDRLFMQDVPVTLLHLLDVPVFEYMDGKVIVELFHEKSALRGKKIRYNTETEHLLRQKSLLEPLDEDSDMVKKRLQDLGYMEGANEDE